MSKGEDLLAEANPDSLSELFSRDPLALSDQDISLIVQKLRRDREKWQVAESKPKGKTSAHPDLNLEDLGF
jgi:hypothetical protein